MQAAQVMGLNSKQRENKIQGSNKKQQIIKCQKLMTSNMRG